MKITNMQPVHQVNNENYIAALFYSATIWKQLGFMKKKI